MSEVSEEVVFAIILHAGNARSEAYQALECAERGAFDEAQSHLKTADQEIAAAHHTQTELVQQEAAGHKPEWSLLLVHAQDHLMTAVSEKTLIEYLIRMHQKINGLEQQIQSKDGACTCAD